jgi:hypothetical protein
LSEAISLFEQEEQPALVSVEEWASVNHPSALFPSWKPLSPFLFILLSHPYNIALPEFTNDKIYRRGFPLLL